jgi:alpha-glucosidase
MRHALLVLLLAVLSFAKGAEPIQVVSPDRTVRFELRTDSEGFSYRVLFRNQPAVDWSRLAMLIDDTNICKDAEPGHGETYQRDEKYPWRGVHSEAVNRCNGLKIPITHKASTTKHVLEVRAFNDGVAFRHGVFEGTKPRVPDEDTTFKLPKSATVWFHDLGGHYEAVHQRKNIAEVQSGEWAAPPLTFKLAENAGYASITEAALVNYSGMALQADGDGTFKLALGHKHPISYPYRLRYSNDIERVSKPASISGQITTPWRVIMVGSDLNALVNSDMVHDLSPAPDPKLFPKGINTDWVRPGRAVWKYLDGGANTFEAMKDFCTWAGELGFEYNILEGFWRRWDDAQLNELVDYGKQKGVGIWLWRHSKELRDPDTRHAFFKKCHDLGIAGVKLDFFDHEAKEIIDYYQTLLRETAENKLLVNFHGANKPTGESRTWPNELVREGVRGMESSRLKERARHNTTLPFTRYLAGHADYTPVHFGARRGDTTWAHQIATAAVFTAPLLTYGAHPTNLLNNPALEMIKSIPAVWDETIVLPQSEIGEFAAFARRRGETWFLAILNGPQQRELKLPCSFLGSGKFQALVVRDETSDPAAVKIEKTTAQRDSSYSLDLPSGGGFIARFSK